MPLMSFDELRNANAGQDLGTFPKNLARAAKDQFCSVYNAFPDWTLNVAPGVQSVAGAIAQDLCRRNPPLPNSPASPFVLPGGQCPVLYDARSRFYGVNNDGTNYDSGWGNWLGMTGNGPFTASTQKVQSVGNGLTVGQAQIRNSSGAVVFNTASAGVRSITDIQIETRRRDLQPDTCGPSPVPPPPVPPAGELIKPVPVPTPNGPPIIVPVVIPVGVLVKPEIQINVGPFDINIGPNEVNISPRVELPDITIRPTEPQPTQPTQPPLPPQRPNVTINSEGGECPDPCPEVDLQEVLEELDLIKSYVRRPKTALTVQNVGGGDSGSFTLPPRTRFVVVSITSTPPQVRFQSGGTAGPDVAYQGWAAVGRNGAFGERIQLSYAQNVFTVPEGCDSFSYTVYAGGAATVSAVVETNLQECQTYECG